MNSAQSISSWELEHFPLPLRRPLQPRVSSKTIAKQVRIPPSAPILEVQACSHIGLQIRRKTSFHKGWDSSEDLPSPHNSIYEAYQVSNKSFEEVGNVFNADAWPKATPKLSHLSAPHEVLRYELAPATVQRSDENNGNPQSPLSPLTPFIPFAINDAQFRYGKGTLLDSIPEKKSNATIHNLSRTLSANNLETIPLLTPSSAAKSPRRKLSFSTNDIPLISNSYHKAIAMIEKSAQPVYEVYAGPKGPIDEPPVRRLTPPGMPSWTEVQRSAARDWRRYRRLRSAYGPIDQHPYSRAAAQKDRAVVEPVRKRWWSDLTSWVSLACCGMDYDGEVVELRTAEPVVIARYERVN